MPKKNMPALIAYSVEQVPEDSDKKPYWQKIGAAFNFKEGEGMTVVLSALPIGNRIVLLPPKDEEDK